jgi:hypothetical protein
MSTSAIVSVKNLSIDRVNFGEAKRNKNGGLGVAIKYDGQNLQLRIPKMAFPGGLMRKEDEKTGNVNYSLIGSLKDCDPYATERSTATTDMAILYNFLLDVQDKLVKTATENSARWFGKKRSEESIRDGFKNILSTSVDKIDGEYVPNGKYPPSLRVKIPVYDERVSMDAIDSVGNPIHLTPDSLMSVFPKGVESNLVISGSIYVVGQGFGVTWRISYAQVFPRSKITAASVFKDDFEEEEQEEQIEESHVVTEEQPATQVEEEPSQPAPTNSRRRRVAVPA